MAPAILLGFVGAFLVFAAAEPIGPTDVLIVNLSAD
jgi:hypothetical protein